MAKQKSRFPSYGLVRGPSHKHGGVAGVVAGEQPVELEGGEWIIPKEVVPDYLPVLKQITNEGRAIQQMENGNTAMDALIASASMETGLAKPKSPMYQEGGQVSFEQIADLAKLYGAKQGITLNPADYTPEGGRSKEGYARKFGLPEDFTVDTLAYSSPTNYSLQFLDAGGEKLGTSKSTGIYPILQDIRAAQINSRLDDKVSLENMSEYMAKQREDSKFRDMFRTLIGSAERNYPKEKQREQGGPVYQTGGEIDYTKTSGLYNRFLAEQDSPEIMGMKDILLYRAMQNPETASAELYDKQSDVGRQFGKDALLTKALLNAIGMEGATESDSLRLVNALSPAGRRLYEGTYAKEQKQGGPVYQTGGEVRRSPTSDIQYVDGKYRAQTIVPIPADLVGGDGGYRYYLSEPQFSTKMSNAIAEAGLSARQKAKLAPADSLPAALVEGYFDRQNKKSPLGFLKKLIGKQEQGGPIDYYQAGGQALPRKQQEMRNPTVYGPPIELMGPMPADTSAVDTTDDEFQHLLNQLRMRDVNQNINPFTGDTIDTYLDSLRLQQRMKKSKIPQSAGRKKARQGGPVMYQEGGMVQGGQALERRPPESMGDASFDNSLMGSIGMDRRVKPVDRYTIKGGEMTSAEMEIPKLSTAYLASFGMETPLSKRQQALLFRKGIAPQTLNPQVKGLINRALVQRLTNEVD
jgi:hypothetical protein